MTDSRKEIKLLGGLLTIRPEISLEEWLEQMKDKGERLDPVLLGFLITNPTFFGLPNLGDHYRRRPAQWEMANRVIRDANTPGGDESTPKKWHLPLAVAGSLTPKLVGLLLGYASDQGYEVETVFRVPGRVRVPDSSPEL